MAEGEADEAMVEDEQEDGEQEEGGAARVDGGRRRRGRRPTARYLFHEGCKYADEFEQKLKDKLKCPKPAGKPPPMMPKGKTSGLASATWRSLMSSYCTYMLACYKPWAHDGTGPIGGLDIDDMHAFVQDLERQAWEAVGKELHVWVRAICHWPL